ncbi:MAG: acyl-CoA thioesterase [Sediminimonas qiaohouensis]|uniref:Acyl-CoA thioesterase n=1 Tax=Sediminimonas qiaohouensis TaxID=552061 RepID=A0A7C9H937_9RHOB|nr:thioesterase family protein [Sediminimonas qiaohouensis]MTJ03106.1 acyl-CoA thioesterase [Sediminimonas qiaohouensis]
MAFVFRQKVLFKHCDPAGIVFYPRYFEMLNDCVEAFFSDILQHPFESLHGTGGVPTAQISARFTAPSRHGDLVDFTLRTGTPGRSSLALDFHAACGGETRLTANSTLVFVDGNGKPQTWPQSLKAALNAQAER